MDATGVLDGTSVQASILGATAAVLVARGADQLLVPAPAPDERERITAGLATLPTSRRRSIRVVDEDAAIWNRILDYLGPIRQQAGKWPEDAFVSFTADFLYELVLASRYRAGIAADSVEVVRGFVTLLDPAVFRGEARFRVAEILNLICRYSPEAPEQLAYRTEIAASSIGPSVLELLETAEYRALVATSGRLGYATHPGLALRRIVSKARELLAKPRAHSVLRLARASAEIAAGRVAGDITSLLSLAEVSPEGGDYWPPFLSLGPAQQGIYRAALEDRFPGAAPPPGAILSFERVRGGRAGQQWLNEGQEGKLEREAAEGVARRKQRTAEARLAAADFLGS